jgi:hypothetical protein
MRVGSWVLDNTPFSRIDLVLTKRGLRGQKSHGPRRACTISSAGISYY